MVFGERVQGEQALDIGTTFYEVETCTDRSARRSTFASHWRFVDIFTACNLEWKWKGEAFNQSMLCHEGGSELSEAGANGYAVCR